jgi:hypothetical protein
MVKMEVKSMLNLKLLIQLFTTSDSNCPLDDLTLLHSDSKYG